MEESYRVMLVRLEGKIDLVNQSSNRTASDIADIRTRLNGHSDRILKQELAAASRMGMVTLAKFLYGGIGAALAAVVAVVARQMGV